MCSFGVNELMVPGLGFRAFRVYLNEPPQKAYLFKDLFTEILLRSPKTVAS